MRKIYKVDVDCANCAGKMEQAIKKIPGIHDATVSFMTQKLFVDFEEDSDIPSILSEIIKKCRKIESDFELYR